MTSDDKIKESIRLLRSAGHDAHAEMVTTLWRERNASAADAVLYRGFFELDRKIVQSAADIITAVCEHRDKFLGDFSPPAQPKTEGTKE